MIYENVELSGSLDISGSFQVPFGLTAQMEDTSSIVSGTMFYNTESGSLYVWEGEWQVMGSQSVAPVGPASADIEYLVVAGGGGAGGSVAGGGGSGGYLSSSLSSIESGSSIAVTIGAGGSGGATKAQGNDGSDSSIASTTGTSFTTITSTGGGAGGASTNGSANLAGRDGGSGGGGSWYSDSTGNGNSGGSGTVGQGNDGGDASGAPSSNSTGGGGGGAGAAGGNGIETGRGGLGGDGKQSSITGTATYYAGGGGGGGQGTTASGGTGGGGTGQISTTNGGAGTANTGGGGGGSYNYSGGSGGSGGSGVAIFAYDSGSINAIGGQEGDAGNGRKYHKFGLSGTFYIGSGSDFQIVTDGLYAHYDLANTDCYSGTGTTITDLAGNVNLTIVSAPPFTYSNGGGLDLDGSADYAYATGLSFTPYCVDYWWTNDDAIGTGVMQGDYQMPLGLGDYPGGITLGAWTGGMTNETIGFWGDDYTSNGATYIRDTVAAGTHNFVANWNGTTYDIWVDGVKKTTYAIDTYGHTTLHSRDSIYIGKEDGTASYEFDGKVHNLRFYTSSLTDAQVTQNYNALRNRFGL